MNPSHQLDPPEQDEGPPRLQFRSGPDLGETLGEPEELLLPPGEASQGMELSHQTRRLGAPNYRILTNWSATLVTRVSWVASHQDSLQPR